MTTYKLKVTEQKRNGFLQLDIQSPPDVIINIVNVLKPYTDVGYKVKTINHQINKGLMHATLMV